MAAEDRQRRKQERRAQRRTRLAEAALDLIAARGLSATTVDEVVAAAHTSKSSFYDFWPSREDLVADLLAERGSQLLGALADLRGHDDAARGRMRRGLERFVEACRQDPRFARLLLVESVGVSPGVEAVRQGLQDEITRMIEAEVRAGALEDPFYDQVDPPLFARALVGATQEAAAHLLDVEAGQTEETAAADPGRVVTGLSAIFAPAGNPDPGSSRGGPRPPGGAHEPGLELPG